MRLGTISQSSEGMLSPAVLMCMRSGWEVHDVPGHGQNMAQVLFQRRSDISKDLKRCRRRGLVQAQAWTCSLWGGVNKPPSGARSCTRAPPPRLLPTGASGAGRGPDWSRGRTPPPASCRAGLVKQRPFGHKTFVTSCARYVKRNNLRTRKRRGTCVGFGSSTFRLRILGPLV